MAGYPGTPLPKKLGIKAGHKVCLLNAPGSVARHLEREGDTRITYDLRLPLVDMVVLFVDSLEDLERRIGDVSNKLHPEGGFWVAWRTRRGCGVSEDIVRSIALAAGMVPNRACAIDATWSGMRLVLRSEIRDALMYRVAQPSPPVVSRRLRRPTAPPRIAHRTLRANSASGGGSSLRRVRASKSK
ncbi:MAG TPA: hypothetical protein VK427_10615 [Kofleriaceae bacterium]|nr:hypothetical protein [Kofleriaceae bacterium]